MSSTTVTRRANALALFNRFAASELARGAPAKGLEQAFAQRVQIAPSLWSQIKSARPIGDKLARQIEHHAGQAAGWLDKPHEDSPPDAAEQRFVELARSLWRESTARSRRELARDLRERLSGIRKPSAAPPAAAR